jgi:hypothetical protein
VPYVPLRGPGPCAALMKSLKSFHRSVHGRSPRARACPPTPGAWQHRPPTTPTANRPRPPNDRTAHAGARRGHVQARPHLVGGSADRQPPQPPTAFTANRPHRPRRRWPRARACRPTPGTAAASGRAGPGRTTCPRTQASCSTSLPRSWTRRGGSLRCGAAARTTSPGGPPRPEAGPCLGLLPRHGVRGTAVEVGAQRHGRTEPGHTFSTAHPRPPHPTHPSYTNPPSPRCRTPPPTPFRLRPPLPSGPSSPSSSASCARGRPTSTRPSSRTAPTSPAGAWTRCWGSTWRARRPRCASWPRAGCWRCRGTRWVLRGQCGGRVNVGSQ